MDKVIIDGVDVSECKNFGIYKNRITQEVYHFCNKSGENCEELKDCYYKQLKRLQAENAELKAELKDYKTSKENSYQNLQKEWQQLKWDIKALTTENERLKEDNNELCKRMAEVTYRVTGGRLSYPNYTLDAIEQAFYDQLEILSDQKSEEYKQALQEIRDIANIIYNTNCNYVAESHKIIAKINEVIGAE